MEVLSHHLLVCFLIISHMQIVLGHGGSSRGSLSRLYGLHRLDRNVKPLSVNFGMDTINRSSFPHGFVFGAGTSAYQIEGAWNVSGKGPSNWDHYLHTYPDRMPDHSNGDFATDSYNQYEDDIRLVKEMNMDAYRFSISWSRVLPKGNLKGGVNEEGIEYYNKVINKTLEYGLKPYVTLFHFDVPHALDRKYGGFLSPRIVLPTRAPDYFLRTFLGATGADKIDPPPLCVFSSATLKITKVSGAIISHGINDFVDFANLCFSRFGDRVKHWVTLNEPYTFTVNGYAAGAAFAPQRCSSWLNPNCTGGNSGTEPYKVAHNLILAHAYAVKLYKTTYQAQQRGEIGITVVSYWLVPLTTSAGDRKATTRAQDFILGWFLKPLVYGNYPSIMKTFVGDRLPRFTPKEASLVKGSFDFIGLNYYTSRYCAHDDTSTIGPSYFSDIHASFPVERNGKLIGALVGTDFVYMYPEGIWRLLRYIKREYKNPIIYVTENGADELNTPSLPLPVALIDNFRINYYYRHLLFIQRAIQRDKVPVKGYFGWSVLDNFEFTKGYTVRFGINYVDFTKMERHQKLSAVWFKNILKK